MTLLLLAMVASVLGLVAGIVLLVVGLAKKRTGLWVAGVILALISIPASSPAMVGARRAMLDETEQMGREVRDDANQPVLP